jgi:hypothetical protein
MTISQSLRSLLSKKLAALLLHAGSVSVCSVLSCFGAAAVATARHAETACTDDFANVMTLELFP